MAHQSREDVSVNTVESLLKIEKDCVQGGLPLQGLLDNDPQCRDVVVHVLS